MKIRYLTLLIFIVIGSTVIAQDSASPRAQLSQYVADLQKSPDDQALREKIIKLALTMTPKPAVPEDVDRFMARGQAAVERAKDVTGFRGALEEFQKASLAAPWIGNIYYNLGYTYEKMGDHAAALRNLKLYMASDPPDAEQRSAKALIYKIEYNQEQDAKDAKAADEERRKNGALSLFSEIVKGKQFSSWHSSCTGKDFLANACEWKARSPIVWEIRDGLAASKSTEGYELWHAESRGPALADLVIMFKDQGGQWRPAPYYEVKPNGTVIIAVNFYGSQDDAPSSSPQKGFFFYRYDPR